MVSASRRTLMVAMLAAGLAGSLALKSAAADVSGIVSYVFEPNPQEIKPKMYNWEIRLSQEDSRNGAYEIVQITRPVKADVNAADARHDVLVDAKMITPNQDGIVDFDLYVGDKVPKQNMGRRGYSGQPIVFSGRGTAKGESSWIVFPGTKIERVVPSAKGTPLLEGKLSLIQFIVSNDRGEQLQSDVVLRRK